MKNKLKVYRAMYDLSQEKLANLVGVSRQTINYIEKGKYTPSVVLALKLSKVFECSVEDIFFLEEDELKEVISISKGSE
ncbi:XRE family transcriptional regulator [Marinitoga sp. 1135]|uniref:Putative transcriptional regulator n=1 Tax=Marinitoga piezophila (strain DSM 14283 / JCM 11233 / KA3) TaxID=443254 RepID=H2J837_MARPK|nr:MULTISPECIES: helix-turn-helix transcriptional regulator [Marinitoga]AEX85528.1 putative transcriptional regulator [Marinitoga piezophila KA3]APT75994.1 XRE family transcriptional regulator [Marinitoga sp. 1137]NUU95735.1 XRE family transcriptional regulator [Marinitoga sp. 1135]NUU97666.1 XRE family transcriptional regulator [Marinitoga sp. 1138]